MKTIIFLLAIASFGIFALAGCGKSGENTNAAATPQNTTVKTNTAPAKTDEPAATVMKPGDVSPDKAVKVIDLVASVAAGGKDAWKGKEVTVTGFVSATATSGKIQTLTIINDQTATANKSIACSFQGDKPDGIFNKTIEVKGKISYFSDGEHQTVDLEPCEIKK